VSWVDSSTASRKFFSPPTAKPPGKMGKPASAGTAPAQAARYAVGLRSFANLRFAHFGRCATSSSGDWLVINRRTPANILIANSSEPHVVLNEAASRRHAYFAEQFLVHVRQPCWRLIAVSSCLISHIAKHAGLPQRKRGKYVPSVGKRLSGRWLRVHDRRRRSLPRCAPHHKLGIQTYKGLASR
jgi:hypothetical protein